MLNVLPLKQMETILSFLRVHLSTAFWIPVDYEGYSVSSKVSLLTVVDMMIIRITFTHTK